MAPPPLGSEIAGREIAPCSPELDCNFVRFSCTTNLRRKRRSKRTPGFRARPGHRFQLPHRRMAEPSAVCGRVVLVSTNYWRAVKKHVADFSTNWRMRRVFPAICRILYGQVAQSVIAGGNLRPAP